MANLRAQAVEGGNLQAMIARVAQQYGASRHRQIDAGNCRCANGHGNCVGCGATNVYKDFQRVRALDGQDGQPGASIADPLFPGTDGHDGVATIHVRHADGTRHEYTSRYELELVDFDVEDENGDGIFEPGEHLFIRRIRVRNTGMSSANDKGPSSTPIDNDLLQAACLRQLVLSRSQRLHPSGSPQFQGMQAGHSFRAPLPSMNWSPSRDA